MNHSEVKIPEILAPAGNPEKLRFAIQYGADAVYIGGKCFSLRNRAGNFSIDEMYEGSTFVHAHGKKIYLALNIFPHDTDLEEIQKFLPSLKETGIDGLIVADPGTFALARESLPDIPIHISTQANLLNAKTVLFWEKLGAKRAVLARELSIDEIANIRKSTSIELETFVHGAMCMAYSGRCLISNVLTGRNANLGDCTQSCRWEYRLHEEKRPGEYFPIIEEGNQSFIMNSKDLNLIRHIPDLIRSGIDSLKIEGRMKSLYYVSAVTRVYRDALDTYKENPGKYHFKEIWGEELAKTSHRGFTTGFAIPEKDDSLQQSEKGGYLQSYDFVGIVTETEKDGDIIIEARNKINFGDRIEWIGPEMASFVSELNELKDEDGRPLTTVNPQQKFRTKIEHPVIPGFLLRRKST